MSTSIHRTLGRQSLKAFLRKSPDKSTISSGDPTKLLNVFNPEPKWKGTIVTKRLSKFLKPYTAFIDSLLFFKLHLTACSQGAYYVSAQTNDHVMGRPPQVMGSIQSFANNAANFRSPIAGPPALTCALWIAVPVLVAMCMDATWIAVLFLEVIFREAT